MAARVEPRQCADVKIWSRLFTGARSYHGPAEHSKPGKHLSNSVSFLGTLSGRGGIPANAMKMRPMWLPGSVIFPIHR